MDGRCNTSKMSIFPKAIYSFSEIQISCDIYLFIYFGRNRKVDSYRSSSSPKQPNNLEKKNKVGGFRLFYFKIYYKKVVIRIVWY